jgi:hypothetical protein
MNIYKWKEEQQRTYNFLDKYDLTEYINRFKGKPVYDLMECLEDELDHKIEFPTYLFNVINSDEFSEYLQKKYRTVIYEVLTIQ